MSASFMISLFLGFKGYTVTGGNITGYWILEGIGEECNEHREYQIAVSDAAELDELRRYLGKLARQLNEQSVFCTIDGRAFLLKAAAKGK